MDVVPLTPRQAFEIARLSTLFGPVRIEARTEPGPIGVHGDRVAWWINEDGTGFAVDPRETAGADSLI